MYQQRRDFLIEGLKNAGWNVRPPKATMFTWAAIPEPFAGLGSLEFTKLLMKEAGVALSPGIGFGPMGEGHVRFSLIEDFDRTNEATTRIGRFLQKAHSFAPILAETANR